MASHLAHGGRDPAVRGPARPSALHPDKTLHAPTQDSDGSPATRRHVTPRCAARPGSCTNDSATVTAAPRPLPDTTVTWLLIELTAAVTLRSTARPIPRHSVRTKLSTPRNRTRMAPKPLGDTSHSGARLGPALARTDSETLMAAPRPMPDTTMTWLLIASMTAVTQRHTPPARPVVPRPDQNRHARRRTPTASLSLGPAPRRGARLGPALHAQIWRP
jgi:hypothetical protein